MAASGSRGIGSLETKWRAVRDRFLQSLRDDPLNLAVFRIAVVLLILASPEVTTRFAVEPPPPELWAPPEGLGWFARWVPVNETFAELARAVVVLSGVFALVGLRTRLAFTALTLGAFYLFAIPQLAGAVRHNMHFLWFSALLAASPAGAALSLDARRARQTPSAYSAGASLWAARILLACVYFFPGMWKLAESGFGWMLSDNLRDIMYWKWYQNGYLPAFRIDRHPLLLRAGAVGVVLFEVGFPLLLATRTTRVVAAGAGLAFHVLADVFLRLPYSALWGCYVVLIDWRWLVDWLYDVPRAERGLSAGPFTAIRRTELALTLFVAIPLISANAVQGFRGMMQGWPFACYPTFQWKVKTTMPDLLIIAVDGRGIERPLLEGPAIGEGRDQRRWALVWRAAGVYGRTNERMLARYYEMARRNNPRLTPPPGTVALRFYRVERSVIPSEWHLPPRRRTLLAVLPLRAAM